MIAYLKGDIKYTTKKFLVMEIDNIGYQVFTTSTTLEYATKNINKEMELFTYQYVRENIIALYGFRSTEEMEMFQILLDISGIGPKLALNILSLDIDKLVDAIRNNQVKYLTSISGVGDKTAERIILELKNKINGFAINTGKANTSEDEEIIEALVGLGYKINDILNLLRNIPTDLKDTSSKIKYLLKQMN
jgi:Holliday junction DNA helicase RuvA